jgi:hypothetical protein
MALRLGLGEFVTGGPNYVARWEFLAAIRELLPEVMEELSKIAESTADTSDQFDDWLRRWHLSDDWLKAVASETLRRWQDHPVAREAKSWHGHGFGWWEPANRPAPPVPWDPRTETEGSYRGRIDKYIAEMKAAEAELGMLLSPEKRNFDHFKWLALYQVAARTQASISEQFQDENGKPDVPAVSRGINDAAALVGIRLRPAQGRGAKP